jgi:hypothetical protein
MFAGWTLFGGVLSFKNIPAIPAVPWHRRILFKNLSLLYAFQKTEREGTFVKK